MVLGLPNGVVVDVKEHNDVFDEEWVVQLLMGRYLTRTGG